MAASGSIHARQAITALDLSRDDGDPQDDDSGHATSGAADTRLAELAAQMENALGQMEQALGLQGGPDGLMELRPLRSDIRILFAVEPPGTALLIAVLHGLEVVEKRFPEAVTASADMLRRVRAGQAPEAAAHTYADTRAFLAEFYPGDVSAGGFPQ